MRNPEREKGELLNRKVFPIVLETPFAVGDVYCYLIKDEQVVLVDCGQYSDTAYNQLRNALKEQDVAVSDIDAIWLTHGHPDHYGQARRLAKESGAVMKGHPKERANFAGNSDRALFRAFFEKHGIPGERIGQMLEQLEWLQQYQLAIEAEPVTEGNTLSSGELHFTVHHAPGHAPGHIALRHESGLIFGGDVLLEHISTNALINFDPDSGERNRSLLQYRHSLQWMQKQQGLVLPGHGKKIYDIAAVAGRHLQEQEQRYRKIKEILGAGPRQLIELSRMLFADALQKGAHFLVLSEVVGYLDWGMDEGVIQQEETGRGRKYVAV